MLPTLVGRESELAAINELLEGIAARGASLLVHGEPGIGKTTLLDAAAQSAADRGIAVLRTAGVPAESGMAFAALHRLLKPQLGRVDALPKPQRDALSSAFGLSNDRAPDVFAIALAVLDLLTEAAAEAPILLIAEDAEWLDADTCDVLTFVARRVDADPVVLLFAMREESRNRIADARLPELHLRGLDDAASQLLLDASSPEVARDPDRRSRLLDTADGNPLALIELSRVAATPGPGASIALVPLPVTERLERAFSERLETMQPATCDLLLVAALDEQGGFAEQLNAATALAGREVTAADLAPAESAGLVAVDEGVRFRHQLVRAAVYAAAPTARRQAAHAALAAAYAKHPERNVWHRAASVNGTDDAVAAALESTAAQALRRGAPAIAALALERAAELTEDDAERGRLLVRAAEIQLELGRSDSVLRLLAQAKPLQLDPKVRARLAFLLETSGEDNWLGTTRLRSFAEIASQMSAACEPEVALRPLLIAAMGCWWGNPSQKTRDLVASSAQQLDVSDDDPTVLAILACADPIRHGARVIDRLSGLTPDPTADPAAMHLLGAAATAVWAFDLSLDFLSCAIVGLRADGRLRLLAQALVFQSWVAMHLAKETLAVSAADEGARLARETGQSRWALAAELAHATVAAERGDFERVNALARMAEAELLPIGAQPMLALVQFARGRGAVAHQLYAEGFDHLKRVLDPSDIAYHPFVSSWALSDLVESAVQIGKRDQAHRYLEQLESLAAQTSGPFLNATLAYARPLLASDETAEALYRTALDLDLTTWPCYRGRLLLNYGRWLRRQRRVAESRGPLRAARENFDALAFSGLAESARRELRASGETSLQRTPDARDQLTPQELQIAELAAGGLSNREIGQQLYLSHRTVESHLYRIYPKLAITSRSQLNLALPAVMLGA